MRLDLHIKNSIFIILGASAVAFGLIHFNIENKLAEGGFTGISLILYFKLGIPTSISYFILNIPVFILGWFMLGKRSIAYTVIGVTALSGWLAVFEKWQIHMPLHDDLMLAALFAGVFGGVGLGIIFRYGGTTGGVDIIAQVIKKYFHISPGKSMFVMDIIVLGASLMLYLNYKEAMYTLVAVFIATRIIDFFNDGLYDARCVMIISENVPDIAEAIATELGRGITLFRAHGYYRKANKDVIYCVVGKSEINVIKSLISNVDPHAFVTVSVVQDVLGEGFTYDADKISS